MSATETDKKVEAEEEKKKGGELLFCGSTCWASVIATKVRLKATWSLPLAFAPSLALKSSSLPPVARRVIALHWMLKGDATLGVAMRALAFMHGNGNLVMGMESSVIDQLLFLNSQSTK